MHPIRKQTERWEMIENKDIYSGCILVSDKYVQLVRDFIKFHDYKTTPEELIFELYNCRMFNNLWPRKDIEPRFLTDDEIHLTSYLLISFYTPTIYQTKEVYIFACLTYKKNRSPFFNMASMIFNECRRRSREFNTKVICHITGISNVESYIDALKNYDEIEEVHFSCKTLIPGEINGIKLFSNRLNVKSDKHPIIRVYDCNAGTSLGNEYWFGCTEASLEAIAARDSFVTYIPVNKIINLSNTFTYS